MAATTTWGGGIRPLGLGERDVVLYLPPIRTNEPIPLIVLLHGAGDDGDRFLRRLLRIAGAERFAMMAPTSQGPTWDAVLPEQDTLVDVFTGERRLAGFGPDVTFLDKALAHVFEAVSVDRARMAIGGFSDGASYALSLGLLNGALFNRVVAFSPGLIVGGVPTNRNERPSVFVAHGRSDRAFPIDRTSRPIVSSLRGGGYDVTFREFGGGHEIEDSIALEAIAWSAMPA